MGKGSSPPTATSQDITQTDLPEYAKPYYIDLMGRAQGESNRPYEPYEGQRIADFTGMQRKAHDAAGQMQRPGQYGAATDMAQKVGLQALGTQWNPGTYDKGAGYVATSNIDPTNTYSAGTYGAASNIDPTNTYSAGTYRAASNIDPTNIYSAGTYRAASNIDPTNIYSAGMYEGGEGYDTSKNQYNTEGGNFEASTFDNNSWTAPGTAQQFMSPYQQNVIDVLKTKAVRDADIRDVGANLDASRRGTYGGSRQLLAQSERDRNLATQLGTIQAQGTQDAYDRGQSAFEQEQNRYQNTQQMGEGSRQFGAGFGQQDRQFGATHGAGQQQFGAQLDAQDRQFGFGQEQASQQEQARQAAQRAQFGSQFGAAESQFGFGQEQASQQEQARQAAQRAQFGSQFGAAENQFGYGQGQQDRQFGARLEEDSAQYGGYLANKNRAQALAAAQGLGALGNMQQSSDMNRLQTQATAGAEMQDMNQRYMDQSYGDFLRQRDYPKEQLNFYNAQLRGVPMPSLSSTSTAYAPPPSLATQLGGAGLAGLGMYQNWKGGS